MHTFLVVTAIALMGSGLIGIVDIFLCGGQIGVNVANGLRRAHIAR